MIIMDHGVRWICEQNNLMTLACPECNTNDVEVKIRIEDDKALRTKFYEMLCICNSCQCSFVLEAEEITDP